MIVLAILLQAAELLGWGTLYLKLKGDTTRQILVHGTMQAQRIPVVDNQMKKLAGYPTDFERKSAEKLTKLVRGVANTQAFQHLLTGVCNSRSPLRKHLRTPVKVRLL